ncbi:TFIIB-type zinc ribbon-containing protein [Bdellovibrio sp. GT3]|uniref:TFIIB-type zinc ribbon-containing protein n=1 Tax=Bdellovibrio sp. GT3 TaxID=3136282 RepID=UPI0030F28659
MVHCPSCQQPVEILDKHLGTLFTCPLCAAVFFVNWDGQPEVASHEVEQETPEQNDNGFVPPIADQYQDQYQDQYIEPTEEPHFQANADSFGEVNADHAGEGFESTPLTEQYSEQLSVAATESEPAYDIGSNESFDYSENLNQPAEPIIPPATSDDANFADVLDFANANTTAGNFSYAVIIEGLDSSQLVYQLKEAITDSKFGWDVSELLTHIGGGRLIIKGLSPAKASVLINRIKYLPFKISWRQDVLSGS